LATSLAWSLGPGHPHPGLPQRRRLLDAVATTSHHKGNGQRFLAIPRLAKGRLPPQPQISVCSEISRASSTSIPKYLTVDSSLEWPSSSWTARRFLVRR